MMTPTESWKELPEDQSYYAYLIEIDGIKSQNQDARLQIDLNNFHAEPAIIPLEATTPQADPRSYTEIHLWDSSNSILANQATEMGI